MAGNCKSCKKNISLSDKTYHCVACDCHIHLRSVCTGLTQVAVSGIAELGMSAMLLCNKCVQKNKRETFIRCITSDKLEEKFEQFNFEAKMEQLKTSLTKLIETKVEEAMKTNSANVEDNYAKVLARSIPKTNETSNSKKRRQILRSKHQEDFPNSRHHRKFWKTMWCEPCPHNWKS